MGRQHIVPPFGFLHLAEEPGEAVCADEAGRQRGNFLGSCPFSEVEDRSQKNPPSDSDDSRKEAKREAEQETEAPNSLPNRIVGMVSALGHG